MRLIILTTLATLATAVPFGSSGAAPTPTPTPELAGTSTSHGNETLESLIAADVKKTSDPTTCPTGHEFKACCKTINNLTKQLIKPVTQLLPVLDGTEISSTMSFQCDAMGAHESNDKCTHDVMCCGGDPKLNKGTNSCMPYDVSIRRKKEALDRNKEYGLDRTAHVLGTAEENPSPSSSKLIAAPTLH